MQKANNKAGSSGKKQVPAMTKSIKDLLPFSDEHVEFLGRDIEELGKCEDCPLYPLGKNYPNCDTIRDKALHMHNEYIRGKQMENKNEILSRKDHDKHMSNICSILGRETLDTEKIALHNAALHAKVGELEKDYDFLHNQIDSLAKYIIVEIDGEPSSSMGAVECAIHIMTKLKSKIVDLEKQNASIEKLKEDEIERVRGAVRGLHSEIEKLIGENAALQARLDEYDPVVMDTFEQAEEKANAFALEAIKNMNAVIRNDHDMGRTGRIEIVANARGDAKPHGREFFDYASPREPQPGDIVIAPILDDSSRFCGGIVDNVDEESIILAGSTRRYMMIYNILPVTHRVNESGAVVPIRRGDK